MDVRCEKCQTLYEFDEANVGPAGLTVKCQSCGNLFKVKRRSGTERGIPVVNPKASANVPAPPVSIPPPPPRAQQPTTSPATPTAMSTDDLPWMIRLASNGEIFTFRDFITLKQWIAERKVTRDDEISRKGENWKQLGSVAELASFFHAVEAAGDEEPTMPAEQPPMFATTPPPALPSLFSQSQELPPPAPPESEGSGPISLGAIPIHSDEPAFAAGSQPRIRASSLHGRSREDDPTLDRDLSPRRTGLWITLLLLLALAGGGVYGWMFHRDKLQALIAPKPTRAQELYRQARESFLLDTDDAFLHATELFAAAHTADPNDALPLAGLAEVNATWAWYLEQDGRKAEAKTRAEEAKKVAGEALELSPEVPEVNRAMADALRVTGAPASEAERYLKRALERNVNDPETVYLGGALLHREGREEEAWAGLEKANGLNVKATQHGLLRAHFLMAKLALAGGRKDDARKALRNILADNAQHERAKTLLASIDAADAGTAAADAGAADLGTVAAATPPRDLTVPVDLSSPPAKVAVAKPPAATKKAPAEEPAEDKPGDYPKLVSQAERMLENGKTAEAKRTYERALALNPRGVEAMTGLGYCDLDREMFLSAIDRFKRVLEVAPQNGDAILGLAEAYKIRGDRSKSAEYYRRFLKENPASPKANMAQKNLADLEPPAPKKQEAPAETAPPLPRPPPTEEPPAQQP